MKMLGKTRAIAAVAVFLLLASVVLMAVPVQAQWYIDDAGTYGMG